MDNDLSLLLDAVRKLGIGNKKASKKIHPLEVGEWRELQKGDVIRSIRGHGPHFVSKDGNKIFQGSYGYFKISEILEEGLSVYEYSPRGRSLTTGGCRFIYMGDTKKVDCINREPHKLLKVNV